MNNDRTVNQINEELQSLTKYYESIRSTDLPINPADVTQLIKDIINKK